jgi:hypothetical protein
MMLLSYSSNVTPDDEPAGAPFSSTIPPETVHMLPLLSTICVAEGMVVPLAEGELTVCAATLAEHAAVAPPLRPLQVQAHGPLPLTAEAAPAVHKLVIGVVVTAMPLVVPQAPFTGTPRGSLVAIQLVPFHDHQLPVVFS